MRGLIRCCLFLCFPVLLWAQDGGTGKAGACIYRFRALWFHEWRGRAVLEYGVSRLTARDVVYKGEDYTLEIYEMPSPEDAFGIYSLHIFKCERTDVLGCIDCLSPYQLQAVVGNKYVSVVFPSGSSAAKDAVDELIRLYLPMDGKEAPQIRRYLGFRSLFGCGEIFARSNLCLKCQYVLAELLEDCPFTGVWFVGDRKTWMIIKP